MTKIEQPLHVIDLSPFETDCHRCGARICLPGHLPTFCWPFYEGFVQSKSDVDYGYVPVCETCCDWLEANEASLPLRADTEVNLTTTTEEK